MTLSEDPNKKKPEEEKNKLSETLESIKKSEKVDDIVTYAKTHTTDTIAYILMVFGIIWLFFNYFYAGLLIGAIAGFYFAKEINTMIKNANDYIEKEGMAKSLILGGTVLALFISAPGIIIGAAIVVGLMQIFHAKS
jgi:hypothetical protein